MRVNDHDIVIERTASQTITIGTMSAPHGVKATLAYVAIKGGPTIVMEARHLRALEKAIVSTLYKLGDNDLESKLAASVEAIAGK